MPVRTSPRLDRAFDRGDALLRCDWDIRTAVAPFPPRLTRTADAAVGRESAVRLVQVWRGVEVGGPIADQ